MSSTRNTMTLGVFSARTEIIRDLLFSVPSAAVSVSVYCVVSAGDVYKRQNKVKAGHLLS